MGFLAWCLDSVVFVSGYMSKRESGFIFMDKFLILKAKC